MTFEEMTPAEQQAVLTQLDAMWWHLEESKQTLDELEAVADAQSEAVQDISGKLDAMTAAWQ